MARCARLRFLTVSSFKTSHTHPPPAHATLVLHRSGLIFYDSLPQDQPPSTSLDGRDGGWRGWLLNERAVTGATGGGTKAANAAAKKAEYAQREAKKKQNAAAKEQEAEATSAAAAGTSHAAATAGGDQAPGAPRAAATSAGGDQAPGVPRAVATSAGLYELYELGGAGAGERNPPAGRDFRLRGGCNEETEKKKKKKNFLSGPFILGPGGQLLK